MIHIELTPKQAEELKNHYILELEKLNHRSAEIIGILSKLAHEPMVSEKPPVTTYTPPPVVQVEEIKPAQQADANIKRRGRPTNNPDWHNYIPQILREQDKPMTKDQIFKSYQKQYHVNLSGSKSAKSLLTQTLQRLRVKYNLLTSTKQKGHKGNFYSLTKPGDTSAVDTAPKEVASTDEPSKTLPANTKYNWPQFITDTLSKTKRILSLKDITHYAMVHYSIDEHDKKVTYGKISPVLSQLSKNKDKIRPVRKEGISRKYYGLTEWFNSKGELITLYK
jgi:hypothetical protein